MLREFDSKP